MDDVIIDVNEPGAQEKLAERLRAIRERLGGGTDADIHAQAEEDLAFLLAEVDRLRRELVFLYTARCEGTVGLPGGPRRCDRRRDHFGPCGVHAGRLP